MNNLLVVEDQKLIRQGIVAMIRRCSVPIGQILECRNGEEALEIMKEQAVEMMKHGVRDYILKPIKREVIENLLENLERELSETKETLEEEERCFLNQLRYLIMNAELAENDEWQDMENRIRRHVGDGPFRILVTSMANGQQFSDCGGIMLEGVEGGVLYLLPTEEANRIIAERDERFCLGVGREHRSVTEALCKDMDRTYRAKEKQDKCPRPLQYRNAELFLTAFEDWVHECRRRCRARLPEMRKWRRQLPISGKIMRKI